MGLPSLGCLVDCRKKQPKTQEKKLRRTALQCCFGIRERKVAAQKGADGRKRCLLLGIFVSKDNSSLGRVLLVTVIEDVESCT